MRIMVLAVAGCDLFWRAVRGIGLWRFAAVSIIVFGFVFYLVLQSAELEPAERSAIFEFIAVCYFGLVLVVLSSLAVVLIEESRLDLTFWRRYWSTRTIREALDLNKEMWPKLWRHYPW